MNPANSSQGKRKASTQGITRITVSGYKSLNEECSIEIRPLTILAGANSSGKSSIMQPLLLMKQTLEATYDPGTLLLNGPNVQFTLATQLLTQNGNKRNDSFSVQIEIGSKNISAIYKKLPKKELDIIEITLKQGERRANFCRNMGREDIIKLLQQWMGEDGQLIQLLVEKRGTISEKLEWEVCRRRCFLHLTCSSMADIVAGIDVLVSVDLYDSRSLTSVFEEHIRKLIHVPGLRGNPERNYKTTAIGSQFSGTFDDYVASVVNHWQKAKDHRLRDLGNALETLGLTWKVDARQIDDTQVELRVGRLSSAKANVKDMVSIADVGFGVSQTLPVLVALLVAEPGQLVYVEQPEIHLHPRAQVAMGQILADAAKRGVHVVVETHSDLLLKRIQSLVAEDYISEDKVKLHWFERGDDGFTKVTSANMTDAGQFGDWPVDFADVFLEEESRYLDAAESKLMKN